MVTNLRRKYPIRRKRIWEHPLLLASMLLLLLTGCSLWHLLFGVVDVKDINHIRDSYGRIVQYRGVNHSNYAKHSPDNMPWHDGSAYRLLPKWGYNLIRFQMYMSAVMPKKDSIDFAYLNAVDLHFAKLESYGIDVVIDWHQDVYGERFGGNGFPEFMTYDNDIPFKEVEPWHMNYKEPAVVAAFTNFWNNTDGIQDKCVETIKFVLKRYQHRKNIVGLDPFNEPFPGIHVVTFEQQYLPNYLRKIEQVLTEDGRGIMLFFEPVIFATTIPTLLDFKPSVKAVYFPHYYDATIDYGVGKEYAKQNWRLLKEVVEIRALEAQEFGVPLMIGEFGMKGGVEGRLQFYDDMMYMADKYQFGWTVYSFDMTIHTSMAMIDTAYNETEIMQKLVRVYPQRIAGNEPEWTHSDGSFRLTYKPDTSIKAPTVVFIPERFKASVSINGGDPSPFGGGRYEHQNDGGVKQTVLVTWK